MQLEDRIDRHFSKYDKHLLQLDEKVDFFVNHEYQADLKKYRKDASGRK